LVKGNLLPVVFEISTWMVRIIVH